MQRLARRLHQLAEDVGGLMLAALFAIFLVQIASRYLFNAPVSWTMEVCLTLWLWTVFWGGAMTLSDRDHVRFDVVYLAVSMPWRRTFAIVSALAIAAGFAAALPATWSFVTFYEIKRSSVIGIRLDVVFSVYILFAVAVVLRGLWRAFSVARGANPDPFPTDGAA